MSVLVELRASPVDKALHHDVYLMSVLVDLRESPVDKALHHDVGLLWLICGGDVASVSHDHLQQKRMLCILFRFGLNFCKKSILLENANSFLHVHRPVARA